MSVQSKCAKIRGKCEGLERKLGDAAWVTAEGHRRFIQIILERCLEEEKQLTEQLMQVKKMERKKRLEGASGEGMGVGQEQEVGGAKDSFMQLSDEVVEMILGKVKEPEDLISCSKTCQRFERILEPTKPAWLFFKILPLVVGKRYLKKRDVIKCRKVCTNWRQPVDDLIQNVRLSQADYPRAPDFDLTIGPCLFGPRKLDRFSETMGNHVGNPFVTRKMTLQYDQPLIMRVWGGQQANNAVPALTTLQYWQKAIEFLEKFGKHLWDCRLDARELALKDHLEIIHHCLDNLQNIRKLSIYGRFSMVATFLDIHLYGLASLQLMQKALIENPLPALPHLVNLELDDVNCLLYTHLISPYAQQLHVLSITLADCRASPTITRQLGQPSMQLANLTKLFVELGGADVSILLNLECPKLSNLELIIGKCTVGKSLGILQHFGGKLEQLKLTFEKSGSLAYDMIQSEYFTALLELQLPCLRKLFLKGWTESLDILLCMPTLEDLKVEYLWNYADALENLSCPENNCGDAVEIWGRFGSLYESNIWALIPFIKNVRFGLVTTVQDFRPGRVETTAKRETYQYSREGYEHFQNKNVA